MKHLALFFCALSAFATTYTATSQATLQSYVNSVVCGDKILIQSGITIDNPNNAVLINFPAQTCAVGNEITIVGTDKESWLPTANTRITPGHKGNLATLRYGLVAHGNNPLLAIAAGATGYKFIGLYVKAGGAFDNGPVFRFGPDTAEDDTELSDNITMDRVYAEGDYNISTNHGNFVYARTKGFTVKNTFVTDWHKHSLENHFVITDTSDKTSLKLVERNYSSTFNEHVFTGGDGGPSFATGNVGNMVVRKNVFYNSLKWYPNSPYYVGSASNSCIKNFIEFKDMVGARVYHNSGYNSWQNCGSQYHAWHVSFRPKMQPITNSGANGTPNDSTADLSTTVSGLDTITLCAGCITDSVAFGLQYRVGAGICVCSDATCQDRMDTNPVGSTNGRWECAEIVTADPVAKVYTVTPPFSNAYAVANPTGIYFARVAGWRNGMSDIVWYGNYSENVGTMMRLTTQDDVSLIRPNPAGTVTWKNNFNTNRSPYMAFNTQYFFRGNTTNDTVSVVRNASYPDPTTLTGYEVGGGTGGSTNRTLAGIQIGNTNNNLMYGNRFENNITPSAAFPFFFDGGNCNTNMETDFIVKGNALETGTSNIGITCTAPRTITPNFTNLAKASYDPAYTNPSKNLWRLQTTSRYYRGGTDGRDLGPRIGSFPVIENPVVSVTSTTATLTWSVPYILQDEVATLECSTDDDIHTDLGPFTVVPDLDPTMFIRRDSNEFNPHASGFGTRYLTWTIGADSTVTDDNGVSRNLALTSNTTHYCRLLQGGAMHMFQFTTNP
jgi:hypothetical protein